MAQSEFEVVEYRIVLPMTVEEYRVGHLWSVAEASKNETGGGEGLEWVRNEPFEGVIKGETDEKVHKGQYTYKIVHLKSKVPRFVRTLAPMGSLEIMEESWNAWPFVRTSYSNPYMKENFQLAIRSLYVDGDRGQIENIHELEGADLENRRVINIDIVNDPISPADYDENWDPSKVKTARSPIPPDDGSWKTTVDPVMCCYKFVKLKFKWFGLQHKVEGIILRAQRRLFLNFHRQVVCWLDKYMTLTLDDVRSIESKTKEELDSLIHEGNVRGLIEK